MLNINVTDTNFLVWTSCHYRLPQHSDIATNMLRGHTLLCKLLYESNHLLCKTTSIFYLYIAFLMYDNFPLISTMNFAHVKISYKRNHLFCNLTVFFTSIFFVNIFHKLHFCLFCLSLSLSVSRARARAWAYEGEGASVCIFISIHKISHQTFSSTV
jgi:hypothetical protein